MSLREICSAYFDSNIRSRGADYFYRGAVRIESGSKTELQAVVKGSRRYDTDLYVDEDTLFLACECPYYASEGFCKHLWACILTAESYNYLTAVKPGMALSLEDDPQDEPYPADPAAYDDDDPEDWRSPR